MPVAPQEHVDLAETQRPRRAKPRHDAVLVSLELAPLGARIEHRARLLALRDLVNLAVVERAITRQLELLRRRDVTRDRLAIHDRLARDLSRALPRLPAAEHFSYVNHRQLPVGHGFLLDGDPRRRRREPSLTSRSLRPRAGPMTLQKARPHDAAKLAAPFLCGWPHDPENFVAP